MKLLTNSYQIRQSLLKTYQRYLLRRLRDIESEDVDILLECWKHLQTSKRTWTINSNSWMLSLPATYYNKIYNSDYYFISDGFAYPQMDLRILLCIRDKRLVDKLATQAIQELLEELEL